MPSVQEEREGPLAGGPARRDDRTGHLHGDGYPGQPYGRQPVLAGGGRVRPRDTRVDLVHRRRPGCRAGPLGPLLPRRTGGGLIETAARGRNPQIVARTDPGAVEGQSECVPVGPGLRVADQPVARVEADPGVPHGNPALRAPLQISLPALGGDPPAVGKRGPGPGGRDGRSWGLRRIGVRRPRNGHGQGEGHSGSGEPARHSDHNWISLSSAVPEARMNAGPVQPGRCPNMPHGSAGRVTPGSQKGTRAPVNRLAREAS